VPNLIVSAVSTFDNKGLKKGQKEISSFEKQIKSFAKVFGAAFSVSALTNYGKKAVQAFMADERAAKSLEQQLKNTGYQFSGPAVEMYIANLQKTTGVLDDQLRPAFQQLLTVTGSLTTSQNALDTALNISAATGKSLTEVTSALSRGYAGNTTGLSRLGAGLSKALLKTGDMDKIMAELNQKFAGQSAARLDTYAGKMDLLTASAENAKEIIGKGLLDSLVLLSKDRSIAKTATAMEDFATEIANATLGMADLVAETRKLLNIKSNGNGNGMSALSFVPLIGPYLDLLTKRGAKIQSESNSQFNTVGRPSNADIAFQLKLLKAKKDELALLNKKNAIENKNVEELKKKFDLERIGINAALNNATDEETKLRLKSQLAILDNNEALAKKYLAELEATEALRKLTEQAKLAGMSLEDFALFKVKSLNTKIDDYLQNTALEMVRALNAQIAAFIASLGGVKTPTSTAAPTYSYALSTAQATNEKIAAFQKDVAIESTRELNSRINEFLSQNNAQRSSSQTPMDIRLTVDAGGDRLSQAIAESIQVATRSGYSTVPNGFIV